MGEKENNAAYYRELGALIQSGKSPAEAKRIADEHYGNYSKVVEEVAAERAAEKENDASLRAYAATLTARIVRGGESPEAVVSDMSKPSQEQDDGRVQ